MSIFFLKLFKVNCFQRCVNVLKLVETSNVEVSALSPHCVTAKELPSSEVNVLYNK